MKWPLARKKDHNLGRSFQKASDGHEEHVPNTPDAAASTTPLPVWDLSDIYRGLDAAELAQDKALLEERAKFLYVHYHGRVNKLTAAELASAIEDYENIELLYGRISAYTTLLNAQDRSNIAKTDPLRNWLSGINAQVEFFETAIADIREQDIMTRLAAPELARFAPWIAQVRANHQTGLGAAVESLHRQFESVNVESWRRLYGETMANIHVEYEGQKIHIDTAWEMYGEIEEAERSTALRQAIAAAMQDNARRVAFIYNVLAKDNLIDAEMRGYARIDHDMLAQNGLSHVAADKMYETVRGAFQKLSQKFYALQESGAFEEAVQPEYNWEYAKSTVLRALRKFSPTFGHAAKKMHEGHIDALPREGKEGGGFCMPMGSGILPYVLINYTDDLDSVVSSLAHETGHAVHQILCDRAQGVLLSDVPTIIAETASIFAEMLVYDELLKSEKDPQFIKGIRVAQVEALLTNGLEQLSFHEFERRFHQARRKGELSADEISHIWVDCQKEFYGPAHEIDDIGRLRWMTITHFFETPFYNFSYSFAQMLVAGLYERYQDACAEGPEAKRIFVDKYVEFLKTGLTKNVYDMLHAFDLDPDTAQFWEDSVSFIEKRIDTLVKDASPAPKKTQKKPQP